MLRKPPASKGSNCKTPVQLWGSQQRDEGDRGDHRRAPQGATWAEHSGRRLVCPVQGVCVAYRTGKQLEIPPVKKRPTTVRVQLFAVVDEKNGQHLMKVSRGLWEFPMFSELPAGDLNHAGSCRHSITHHRLEVQVYTGTLASPNGFQLQDVRSVPVSSLTRKILAASRTGGADVEISKSDDSCISNPEIPKS